MKKLVSLLLVCALALALLPLCAAEEVSALQGVYVLDASGLGMPLKVYCVIDGDGNFMWTNKPEGGADKGAGRIGAQDGVYMMVYNDSTVEKMKTATFTLSGRSLVFSTRVPYGSSGFAPNTEDENNVIYPVAEWMAYEEYLGEYAGVYVSEGGPMGTVSYDLSLTLSYGARARFVSACTVMGEKLTYEVNGLFAIADGMFTLTPDAGGAITGTIGENGDIAFSAALSVMSVDAKTVALSPATTAAYAGEYAGQAETPAGLAQVLLTLGKTGAYARTLTVGASEAYEDGMFTAENGALTLLPAVMGGAPQTGVIQADTVSLSLPAGGAAVDFTLYADRVRGVFAASGADESGNEYASTLTLNPDGTYAIEVLLYGAFAYAEEGTFATEESSAGVSIVLTDGAGVESAGIVSDTLNITHNIDYAFNTLGFKYVKQ